MRMYSYILFLLLISSGTKVRAQDISVSLFHEHHAKSLLFSCVSGQYLVMSENDTLGHCSKGQQWTVLVLRDSLFAKDRQGAWHAVKDIGFFGQGDEDVMGIKLFAPVMKSGEYEGDFHVSGKFNGMQVLNIIPLEKYIEGVTETEAGPSCPLEYYKVQAILSRTFSIKNIQRHQDEGFNLCDGIHCQAYKGKCKWNVDVEIGTEVSEGIILCDQDSVPLNAAYHSNSGGETQGAGAVWLKEEAYLRPVLDPFSLGQKNAVWKKSIAANEWFSYLNNHGFKFEKVIDTLSYEALLIHREKYYVVEEDTIPYRLIREDMDLRSSFFDILYQDGEFLFKGRGYGHGVGLSQEGAINMARKGYHHTEILNYYYYEVMLVDSRLLKKHYFR